MTSNATVVSSQAYGNGTYYATESTGQSNTVTTPAFTMFDNDITTYYEQLYNGASYYYNGTTGALTGATGTPPSTIISTVSVAGWWVQIQAPTSFILRNYTIVGRQTSNFWTYRVPNTFWIAGSNDAGTTWSNVHYQAGITFPPQLGKNYTVPLTSNSVPYSYYRMVVSVIGSGAGNANDILNIASWNLFGDSPSYTTGSSDFYADRLGNLLTAPVTGTNLATWLGGSTGYVATWYDQSGRGNHVSQSTQAVRPTIGTGVITFTGTQWFANTATTGGFLADGQQKYSYAACFNSANAGTGTVCDTNNVFVTSNRSGRLILIGGNAGFSGEANDAWNMTPFTAGNQKSVVMIINNANPLNVTTVSAGTNNLGTIGFPYNGTLIPADSTYSSLNLSNDQFGIGRKMTSGSEYFTGTMKSVMVFNTALSASDAAIIDAWQQSI